MKCVVCSKEVDEKVNEIPPKWYGKYASGKLVDVICDECIKKPGSKEVWKA